MSEETIAVEPTVEKAPEVIVPEASQEPTAAELLAAKDEEIAQLEQEKENYRKGLLKAKGKLPTYEEDDDDESESTEEKIRRVIREEMQQTEIEKKRKEREAILANTLRENEELKNALKKRAGSPSSTGGTAERDNQSKAHPYWSEAQLTDLKSRGLDPDKVYQNMSSTGAPGQMAPNPIPDKK